MRKKLTLTEVKTLPSPAQGKQLYWDTTLSGFALKVTPTTRTYIAQAKQGGGREGRSLTVCIGNADKISLSEARLKAKRELLQIRAGENPTAEKKAKAKREEAQGLTLAKLFNEYVSKRDLRPRTKQTYEGALHLCVPDWNDKPITSITRNMIETRLQQVADVPGSRGNRKAQAAQCYTLLRALFRFAADRYEVDGKPLVRIVTKNVAKGKSWAKAQVRDNIIRPDDLSAWWQATEKLGTTEPLLRDFYQLLLFSGMRRSEALKLRWDYIDTRDETITIPAAIAKSGCKRVIPLTDMLQVILKRRHDAMVVGNPFVFPSPARARTREHLVEPRGGLAAVRKESKLAWTLHDCRRSYATYSTSLISFSALKELLGHAASDVTSRHYIKLDPKTLKAQAQIVADWLKLKCGISQERIEVESPAAVISTAL